MADRVSNNDIMQTLGRIEEKVDNVTALAQKTNGRVTTIENWKNAIEAVEAYKEKNMPQVAHADTVILQQKWFQNEKLVSGVVGLLLAIAAAIGFFVGGGTP